MRMTVMMELRWTPLEPNGWGEVEDNMEEGSYTCRLGVEQGRFDEQEIAKDESSSTEQGRLVEHCDNLMHLLVGREFKPEFPKPSLVRLTLPGSG